MAKKEKKIKEEEVHLFEETIDWQKYLYDYEDYLKSQRESFSSSLRKQLGEIDTFYEKKLKAARKAGEAEKKIDSDAKAEAKKSEEKNKAEAYTGKSLSELEEEKRNLERAAIHKHVVSLLKIESDLAIRKMKINKDSFFFSANLRKKELQMLISQKENVISKLSRIDDKNLSVQDKKELEEAKIEKEEYEKELSEISWRRTSETLAGIKQISGELSKTGGAFGNLFSGISENMDNLQTVFKKDATPSVQYAAAASGAASLVGILTSSHQQRKAEKKAFELSQMAYTQHYDLGKNQDVRTQTQVHGSKLINNYQGRITDGFKALADAEKKSEESIGKLSEGKAKKNLKTGVDWANVGKGAAAGAAVGALAGPIGAAIGAGVGAIFGGIFGRKKKKKYGALLEEVPDLVDAEGNLNKERAEALLATDQVDDKTKQLIKDSLEWADAVEKAKEQIKGVVKELAGDLGTSLDNAMVGAWKSGGDASVSMFDSAEKSLENFLQNQLYSEMFGDIFNDFEDKLVDALDPEGGENSILGAYDWLMDQMATKNEEYAESLEKLQEFADERGFDLWAKDYGLTLDALKASLLELVKQADLSFGSISQSFNKQMSEAIMAMVKNQYLTKALEGWYEQFKKSAKDGELTEAEVEQLRQEYKEIIEKGNKDYKDLMEAAGLNVFGDIGITFESLKTSLNDFVKQAKLDFSKIGKTFEDEMSNAIMSLATNQYLTDALEKWYVEFEKAIKDGTLSADEVKALRIEYEATIKSGNEKYKELMAAAGLNVLRDIGISFEDLQKGLKELVKETNDITTALSKSFKDQMSEGILNMVKEKYLTKQLNDWMTRFSMAMDDELITKEETDALSKEYEAIVKEGRKRYQEALEAAGLNVSGITREASASGIASMSQDSASELNGNFYALIYLVDDIHKIMQRRYGMSSLFSLEESNQSYMLPTMKDMLTVSRSSNTYLLDIRNNTSHLIAIDSNIGNMNQNILAIRNEGVKMRS